MCGGDEIRDKMGINPNVYMHAIYILAEGLNKTYIMAAERQRRSNDRERLHMDA